MLLSTDLIAKKQHDAVRNKAGWYYFTHNLIEVSGKDSAALLDYIYTNSIGKAAAGRAKYTIMLDENGIIQDDVVIFRMEEEKFWISTLHLPRTLEALKVNKGDKDAVFRDITKEWDMYSVQGPKSKELVNAVVVTPVDDIKFFSIVDNKVGDQPVKVARSGYTGEKWGYEIYVPVDKKEIVEEALRDKEKNYDAMQVTEIDVMAYTLATEKGFVLMTDICFCNPFEVDMDRNIDWSKDFIGKAALEAIKNQPPKRALVGLKVADTGAKVYGGPKGAPINKNGVLVGKVTKFTYGFTMASNIGFALIDTDKAAIGDHVIMNNGTKAVLTNKVFC